MKFSSLERFPISFRSLVCLSSLGVFSLSEATVAAVADMTEVAVAEKIEAP